MSAVVVFKAAQSGYHSTPGQFPDPWGSFEMAAAEKLPSNTTTQVRSRQPGWMDALVRPWPFLALFLVVFFSNALGSFFNVQYNQKLIVERLMSESQKDVFDNIVYPGYNAVAYCLGISLTVWLFMPLSRCRRMLRAGKTPSPERNWKGPANGS